jgi:nucleoside-diphosphate-sugar epimerase
MRVLITGGEGFIGSAVTEELSHEHEVITTWFGGGLGQPDHQLDLTQLARVRETLARLTPEVIINCAGVVTNDANAKLNELFTSNILRAVDDIGLNMTRVVIMGSASEYGEVKPNELPVAEDTPLRATSLYGISKLSETTFARTFAIEHNIPLVVARIFNPVGLRMPPRLLIPTLQRQAQEIKSGKRFNLEVSRLDSERDYIDVRDVATAIRMILLSTPSYDTYNVGSGKATSTSQLVSMVLRSAGLDATTHVTETRAEKEPTVASRADISRIQSDLGWAPGYSLLEIIKEIFNGIK